MPQPIFPRDITKRTISAPNPARMAAITTARISSPGAARWSNPEIPMVILPPPTFSGVARYVDTNGELVALVHMAPSRWLLPVNCRSPSQSQRSRPASAPQECDGCINFAVHHCGISAGRLVAARKSTLRETIRRGSASVPQSTTMPYVRALSSQSPPIASARSRIAFGPLAVEITHRPNFRIFPNVIANCHICHRRDGTRRVGTAF